MMAAMMVDELVGLLVELTAVMMDGSLVVQMVSMMVAMTVYWMAAMMVLMTAAMMDGSSVA